MKKNLSLSITEDICEKFELAAGLMRESIDDAAEKALCWYISNSFNKTAQIYSQSPKYNHDQNAVEGDSNKARRKIPTWAAKPNQYNHKIIRSYFIASRKEEKASLAEMERLCSDVTNAELYVPTFRTNYAQMKIDTAHSHGRVFEDDGTTVWIWSGVEDVLMQYRPYFID